MFCIFYVDAAWTEPVYVTVCIVNYATFAALTDTI